LVKGVKPEKLAQLEQTLSPYFSADSLLPSLPTLSETIQSWLHTLETEGKRCNVLGLYGLHEKKLCLLRLKRDADLQKVIPLEELSLWRKLDVALLQQIVLRDALGIDTLEKEAQHLEFTRDALEAISKVDSGAYQMAFLINPTRVSTVLEAADAGKRLPQKSTYFYPKTPAGLVINPLWDNS
jgi:hypothetical protein